jgi:hypothetical protein
LGQLDAVGVTWDLGCEPAQGALDALDVFALPLEKMLVLSLVIFQYNLEPELVERSI